VLKFILKRLFSGILVLLGIVVVIFFLFNILPGDPARMMLGQRADSLSISIINKDLGRDQSLSRQFFMYLNDLSPLSIHNKVNKESFIYLAKDKYPNAQKLFQIGNEKVLVLKFPYLRRSYQTNRKVSDIIFEALPETALLAVVSMLIASLLGVFIGIIAALNKGNFIDNICLVLTVFGMAGPSFFVGIIIAWIFGYVLTQYTGLNMTGSLFTQDDYGNGEYLDLKNIILPAVTLGIRPLAIITQLTRSSLLDVLSQDYVRTAKAKGLAFYRIITKHVLKNAMSPVITTISGWFAGLMAGAVFIEYIFGWKGIGKEIVDALEKYDLPVVMGAVLVFSIIFIFINLIVDILYGLLDPRIRLQ
jgi:peptide/nickel transport system permease protein